MASPDYAIDFAVRARHLSDELWKAANRAESHPLGGSPRPGVLSDLLLEMAREIQDFSSYINERLHQVEK